MRTCFQLYLKAGIKDLCKKNKTKKKLQHVTNHNVNLTSEYLFFKTVPQCIGRVRRWKRYQMTSYFTVSLFVKQRGDYNLYLLKRQNSSPGCCGSVGWSVGSYTQRMWVRFYFRAHPQVVGSDSYGVCNISLSLWCFSLSPSLFSFHSL